VTPPFDHTEAVDPSVADRVAVVRGSNLEWLAPEVEMTVEQVDEPSGWLVRWVTRIRGGAQ